MSTSVAASPTPELSPTMVARLCRTLREEREAQRRQLADLHSTLDEVSGQSDVDSMVTREMTERAIVRGLAVIAEIEHALSCVASGTYGLCERCHRPISPARLEAIPYARHCISCPVP